MSQRPDNDVFGGCTNSFASFDWKTPSVVIVPVSSTPGPGTPSAEVGMRIDPVPSSDIELAREAAELEARPPRQAELTTNGDKARPRTDTGAEPLQEEPVAEMLLELLREHLELAQRRAPDPVRPDRQRDEQLGPLVEPDARAPRARR